MPSSPAMPPPPTHSPVRKLLLLTVGVLLIHGLLLGGVPSAIQLFASGADSTPPKPVVASFVTRTIAHDPAPVVQPVATSKTRTVRTKPVPAPAANNPPPPAAAAPATDLVGNTAVTTSATSSLAAAEPPANTPVTADRPVAAASGAADATQAAPPEARKEEAVSQRASPVSFPQPIRLLYDGRGEERGFIKYVASSELLWLHDGGQYSARLEISAWGFRVRTWTSKGTLGESGLAPVRFGDKPRGAELATHFQRDKGIISFSANNPDVPLQEGAQDKLSALLQLGALVAGAPERYSTGSSIRFQAADAHNAQPWNFQVGGMEALELPGGPKQALKLSKAPTAEFDQSIEVWLAPDMHYLPVRLRITEANGAFADLLWRKTQNSE